MACFPVTWMFEDAGRSVLGSYTQAHLNPLRWSTSLSFNEAVAALKEELREEERPVRINLSRNSSSHQIIFETILDAVDYLQLLVLEDEEPAVQVARVELSQPGPYKMKERACVTAGVAMDSGDVTQVAPGTLVEVVEVKMCPDDRRIRVRIVDPAGWISLRGLGEDSKLLWALPAEEVAATKPATDTEPLASNTVAAPAAVAADDASEKAAEEIGVSQSIIETPERASPSVAAADETPEKVVEVAATKPATDTEPLASHMVAAPAAVAADDASENAAEEVRVSQSIIETPQKASPSVAAADETPEKVLEAAGAEPTAEMEAPMQKSRTEVSSKDRRYDFGFAIKLKRCCVCNQLGLNRGDKESKKIYCVAHYNDIKC